MKKGITVAICLDDEGGMTFFGKRQSRDRVLIGELCDSTDGPIYINSFSTHLFKEREDRIAVVENQLEECPEGGVAFVENLPLLPHLGRISEIILYKWNVLYPSDKKLDISLSGFEVVSKKEFAGSSHDKITKLTMRKKL